MIRDFVYLDWERIRSFSAQLLEGIPEASTTGRQHDIGGEGEVEGGLPFVAKARGSLDYRYFNTQTETKSLHHFVYSRLEEGLDSRSLLTQVDSSFRSAEWTLDTFTDGQFVKVTGVIRLMDYGSLSTTVEALPKLISGIQQMEIAGLKKKLSAREINQVEFNQAKKQTERPLLELKEAGFMQLPGILRELYGEAVRVKVVPDMSNPKNVFVGTGSIANFQDTAASLTSRYGHEIDAGWRVVGQVNVPGSAATAVPIPVGNEVEDRIEELALMLVQLTKLTSSVAFPALSITPLAIYRDVENTVGT